MKMDSVGFHVALLLGFGCTTLISANLEITSNGNNGKFVQGSEAILTCTISPYTGSQTWKVNGVSVADCGVVVCSENMSNPERYSFTPNLSTETFVFTINPVDSADDGNIDCLDGSSTETFIMVVTEMEKPFNQPTDWCIIKDGEGWCIFLILGGVLCIVQLGFALNCKCCTICTTCNSSINKGIKDAIETNKYQKMKKAKLLGQRQDERRTMEQNRTDLTKAISALKKQSTEITEENRAIEIKITKLSKVEETKRQSNSTTKGPKHTKTTQKEDVQEKGNKSRTAEQCVEGNRNSDTDTLQLGIETRKLHIEEYENLEREIQKNEIEVEDLRRKKENNKEKYDILQWKIQNKQTENETLQRKIEKNEEECGNLEQEMKINQEEYDALCREKMEIKYVANCIDCLICVGFVPFIGIFTLIIAYFLGRRMVHQTRKKRKSNMKE